MTTVVNNPPEHSDTSSGIVLGIVILVVVFFLMVFVGMPYLRGSAGSGSPTQINVPDNKTQAPQINIPDKINVNLQNGQK